MINAISNGRLPQRLSRRRTSRLQNDFSAFMFAASLRRMPPGHAAAGLRNHRPPPAGNAILKLAVRLFVSYRMGLGARGTP